MSSFLKLLDYVDDVCLLTHRVMDLDQMASGIGKRVRQTLSVLLYRGSPWKMTSAVIQKLHALDWYFFEQRISSACRSFPRGRLDQKVEVTMNKSQRKGDNSTAVYGIGRLGPREPK